MHVASGVQLSSQADSVELVGGSTAHDELQVNVLVEPWHVFVQVQV